MENLTPPVSRASNDGQCRQSMSPILAQGKDEFQHAALIDRPLENDPIHELLPGPGNYSKFC
jgi:hypothetical protein